MLFRFLADMPAGGSFIVFGILLGMTESVGWAMSKITAMAILPDLYPSHVGLQTVSIIQELCELNYSQSNAGIYNGL